MAEAPIKHVVIENIKRLGYSSLQDTPGNFAGDGLQLGATFVIEKGAIVVVIVCTSVTCRHCRR